MVKMKLSLCLIKYYAMKTYRGVEVYLHVFLNSALDGGEWWVSFVPRPLYLRERAPGTHWIGGWVGPIVGLDALEKRR
jgi:hypothetical protein